VTPSGRPRIPPLPRERWDDDVRAAFEAGFGKQVTDRFFTDGPDAQRAPNALTTLMHHPRLARRFLAYNGVLLFDPALEPRLRELAVLRVAWRTRSRYEWVQHVRMAERVGITADEIDAIARGAQDDGWSAIERDVLTATDELIDGYRIADDTWTRLAEHLDERRLVELVYVVGTYTCLAMVFNSLGLELDPELASVPAPTLPDP